ncbi:MAG: FAD-dependent oxidoreductase [Chloroflexota bacterium]
MPRVVVIGAGVVGAAVAYRLAGVGAQVTLVDQGAPGEGTTSTSFAWLNANHKPPAAYHTLNVAGIAAHTRLGIDLGAAPWLHPTGNLTCVVGATAAKGLAAHVIALQGSGYAAQLIDRQRAQELVLRHFCCRSSPWSSRGGRPTVLDSHKLAVGRVGALTKYLPGAAADAEPVVAHYPSSKSAGEPKNGPRAAVVCSIPYRGEARREGASPGLTGPRVGLPLLSVRLLHSERAGRLGPVRPMGNQ